MFNFKIIFLALMCFTISANAQKTQKSKEKPALAIPVKKADSLPSAPKPYNQVITDKAKTSVGLFKVHLIGLRYFFEIPDSLLGRDILVVNRIAKSAAGPRPQMTGYAGDEIAENVIHFEKGPNDRLFLKRMSFEERSDDSTANGMYRSVINSNLQPIVASFPIKAYSKDSSSIKTSVIDVTDYLNSENEIFYFGPFSKKTLSIGTVQPDKSYISSVKAYPMNIEIRAVRTYLKVATSPQTVASTIPDTYELNSSMVILPKVPMKPRFADARVGYFSRGYVDFDANPQGVKKTYMITRWRLEPKDADIEKYKRGELVEPKKPIVYYIDPATPKKWIPYLIAGINDWQVAFEQAGFKNAIYALPAPENDSTWNIDDARHNVIVYKPSSVANASGPHVHDPRSGEIIETHVNWYHNIMQLVHDWYMIQAGAIDPRARKPKFDDELMGQLIRFVSSHEVGHTLGLSHNFGSSSTVPVEKLRDKAFVEAHGHTPSIMDYARFNYVAQPEDGISEKGIFPRIGDYDKWAIEWGYKWLSEFKTSEAEAPYLNKLIIDSLKSNKRLFFGGENSFTDPRSQSEDLGDDAMLAGSYGIKNLKRILPHLKEWTSEPLEGYDNLNQMYINLLRQYMLYTAHVEKIIAGDYVTPKSIEQPGAVFEPVEYIKQKEAMKFLDKYLFTTPEWLLNDEIFSLTNTSPDAYILSAQSSVLQKIQGSGVLSKLIHNESTKRPKSYTATEFLNDLKISIWNEVYSHKPIDIYRRNLQKMYIENCFKEFVATNEIVMASRGSGLQIYINPDPTKSDVSSFIRAHLVNLRNDIHKAIPLSTGFTRYHLQDMYDRITNFLTPKGVSLPLAPGR